MQMRPDDIADRYRDAIQINAFGRSFNLKRRGEELASYRWKRVAARDPAGL